MEIRRLIHSVHDVETKEIAYFYIQDNILSNKNILIPRLFNKIWVILSNIKKNPRPNFFNTPEKINFVLGKQKYSGEIIKRLTLPSLKGDVFEVKIDQHPLYHRVLFIIREDCEIPFVLFTYGFAKTLSEPDYKTNYYSLLSDTLSKKCHIYKEGVEYL